MTKVVHGTVHKGIIKPVDAGRKRRSPHYPCQEAQKINNRYDSRKTQGNVES